MAEPFLTLSAAVADRGVDLDFAVERGEIVAVTGPNGAGKSTLLDLLAGLQRPDSGRITLDGTVLADDHAWVPAHRRRVVLMAQQTLLFPHLTVRENVAFGPRSHGDGRRASRLAAERWLAEVGASDLADRKATELSGGQAQRVALARALAAEPTVLLLDEPLAALDVEATPAMRALLSRVLAGRTAVIVSHDPEDVAALATRTVRLEDGRMVGCG